MTFSDFLGPDCALFLDFDGTLVDIAARPEAVVVPSGLVDMLTGIRALLDGAVAVVSGRPIEQLDHFLQPARLAAAGVHGAERRRGDGSIALVEVPDLGAVIDAAQALTREHPQLQLEHKRGSLALHYRQAPQLEPLCLAAMQAAVDRTPGLALLRGKMVLEAKPAAASKGHAIEEFLREAPFTGRRPVFVGDDITDEVGFSAVQRLGGVGVKVGEGASVATHRLNDPGQVRDGLAQALAAARVRR
ncbi:trehalose-phosphatase [Ramlibacter sp. AN1015]|uniref:trehalose-phosphatase n=1 Tax=Ramlibacter sp. AN1015 TaxID=3133428 RepID=UPI0030BD082B